MVVPPVSCKIMYARVISVHRTLILICQQSYAPAATCKYRFKIHSDTHFSLCQKFSSSLYFEVQKCLCPCNSQIQRITTRINHNYASYTITIVQKGSLKVVPPNFCLAHRYLLHKSAWIMKEAAKTI